MTKKYLTSSRRLFFLAIPRLAAIIFPLLLVPKLLEQAGANWAGAYFATALTLIFGINIAYLFTGKILLLGADAALTTELVFMTIFVRGVPPSLARWTIFLAAILLFSLAFFLKKKRVPIDKSSPTDINDWQETQILPPVLSSGIAFGLGLLLVHRGLVEGSLIIPAVMTPTRWGNPAAPEAFITWLSLFAMAALATNHTTRPGALTCGWLFAVITAFLEGFLDFSDGFIALPQGLNKIWFAFSLDIDEAASYFSTIFPIAISFALAAWATALSVKAANDLEKNFPSNLLPNNLSQKKQQNISGHLTAAGLVAIFAACLGTGAVAYAAESAVYPTANRPKDIKREIFFLTALIIIFLFFAPFFRVIGNFAATTASLLIAAGLFIAVKGGASLFSYQSKSPTQDFINLEIIASLLTAFITPLTMSLTDGLGIGIISYVVLAILNGKKEKINCSLWVLTALYIFYFYQNSY